MPEFHLFLPQMRMPFDALRLRADAAERNGFAGLALMDHLAPPVALEHPMYEAIVTATWLATGTERLRVGHLVLCDALHHPAVLARQAVSIDHLSGGRFELGIGSGSLPDELPVFGFGTPTTGQRIRRLGESLEIMRALWTGESVDHQGEFFTLVGARQQPMPLTKIPIVIGGAGPKMLQLVARHADWWNLPVHELKRLDELRSNTGDARVSIQQMVTLVADEATRADVVALAGKRFGWIPRSGRATGTTAELADHFGALTATGVERFYIWFSDFSAPETLERFGDEVIATLGR
jgi:alkanesulfonate monooxygenase SsuD/methylene tetrahydromethanopterin reductase-like flavin-dependent oxidoreductase (luciferase family)